MPTGSKWLNSDGSAKSYIKLDSTAVPGIQPGDQWGTDLELLSVATPQPGTFEMLVGSLRARPSLPGLAEFFDVGSGETHRAVFSMTGQPLSISQLSGANPQGLTTSAPPRERVMSRAAAPESQAVSTSRAAKTAGTGSVNPATV